jgi:hypothetical protein
MAILISLKDFRFPDFNVSVDEWFHRFTDETLSMYIDQSTNGNPDVAQAKAGASTLFAAALHDLCFTCRSQTSIPPQGLNFRERDFRRSTSPSVCERDIDEIKMIDCYI